MKKTEHKKEEHKKTTHKVPKQTPMNTWMAISVILAIVLVLGFFTGGCNINAFSLNEMSGTEASEAVVDFVNANGLPPGVQAEISTVNETAGLYLVSFTVQGEIYSAFISKDGRYLFPQAIDLSLIPDEVEQPTEFDAPDTNKPKVELFVMSFCPYGQQAETAIIPVVNLMGDSITVEPHFIVSIDENDNIIGLHGENEVNENIRQAVIWKYYPDTFWKYVNKVNQNCNLGDIETCWETQAEAVGLDVADIEEKVESDGLDLMKADTELTNSYGARSSPTMMINGVKYVGARSPQAFRDGICTGFIDIPKECGMEITDQVAEASGSC